MEKYGKSGLLSMIANHAITTLNHGHGQHSVFRAIFILSVFNLFQPQTTKSGLNSLG